MSSPGRNFRGKVNADSPLIPVRSFLSDLGVEVLSGETGLFAGPRLISWKGSPFRYWVLKSIRSHPFDYLFLSYYINVPSSEIFSAVPVIVSAGFHASISDLGHSISGFHTFISDFRAYISDPQILGTPRAPQHLPSPKPNKKIHPNKKMYFHNCNYCSIALSFTSSGTSIGSTLLMLE